MPRSRIRRKSTPADRSDRTRAGAPGTPSDKPAPGRPGGSTAVGPTNSPRTTTRSWAVDRPEPSPDDLQLESPRWIAPLMVVLFLVGLLWIVVWYLAGNQVPGMSSLGSWNLLIGFGVIAAGFVVATRWR